MKKILFILALVATTLLSSCDLDYIKLNDDVLFLVRGDRAKLKVKWEAHDQLVRWHSSDEFIATVNDDGVVIAKHIGVTHVIAEVSGKELVCEVYVDPIIEIYDEPITTFGRSKSYIMRAEKRLLIGDSRNELSYYDPDTELFLYIFKDNSLESVVVTLNPRVVSSTDFAIFINERYEFVSKYTDVWTFQRDYISVDIYADRNGINIVYYYNSRRSSSQTIMQQRELNCENDEELETTLQSKKIMSELDEFLKNNATLSN